MKRVVPMILSGSPEAGDLRIVAQGMAVPSASRRRAVWT